MSSLPSYLLLLEWTPVCPLSCGEVRMHAGPNLCPDKKKALNCWCPHYAERMRSSPYPVTTERDSRDEQHRAGAHLLGQRVVLALKEDRVAIRARPDVQHLGTGDLPGGRGGQVLRPGCGRVRAGVGLGTADLLAPSHVADIP